MTAVNHVLAGALIGATIHQPVIALPLALASHFVLDALPHYGFHQDWQERMRHKKLLRYIYAYDTTVLLVVLFFILRTKPTSLVIICGGLAILPDLAWVYRYIFPEKWGTKEPTKGNWLTRFHNGIQKFEFKEGMVIEVAMTVLLSALLAKVL